MSYEDLKSEIVEISQIASSVPEEFRSKCFEILLSHLLASSPDEGDVGGDADSGRTSRERNDDDGLGSADRTPLPIRSQLRVLMNKTGVSKEELDRVVMFEEGEAHFISEPSPANVATGQIEWSLLLALKNAVENNKLETDPEDVRSMCQEKGFYDKSNFSANFKKASNAALFRNLLEGQGDAQPLSSDGQTALGKLIKRLALEQSSV